MLPSPPFSPPNSWSIRLLTLSLAAGAAASAVFWVLQWPGSAAKPLATIPATPTAVIDSQLVARLLGNSATPDADPSSNTPAPSNVQLLGVIAVSRPGATSLGGSALLAIPGAGAKPYRVGDEVNDGLVLQAVRSRSVVLGHPGQPQGQLTLELPLLPGMTDSP